MTRTGRSQVKLSVKSVIALPATDIVTQSRHVPESIVLSQNLARGLQLKMSSNSRVKSNTQFKQISAIDAQYVLFRIPSGTKIRMYCNNMLTLTQIATLVQTIREI
jgi:hypothetical protein